MRSSHATVAKQTATPMATAATNKLGGDFSALSATRRRGNRMAPTDAPTVHRGSSNATWPTRCHRFNSAWRMSTNSQTIGQSAIGTEKRMMIAKSAKRIRGGLTFDMRGGRKQAKTACGRPLDGRVRPQRLTSEAAEAEGMIKGSFDPSSFDTGFIWS